MLYAAYPLYQLGGDRARPAAPDARRRARARSLRAHVAPGGSGGAVGARSGSSGSRRPSRVYALDFWEHTHRARADAVGVVLLRRRRASGAPAWRGALAAGALFGVAATMRTEALVYSWSTSGLIVRRAARAPPARGAPDRGPACAASSGAVVLLVANQLLERVDLGADAPRARASAPPSARRARSATTRARPGRPRSTGINGFSAVGRLASSARSSSSRRRAAWILAAAIAGASRLGAACATFGVGVALPLRFAAAGSASSPAADRLAARCASAWCSRGDAGDCGSSAVIAVRGAPARVGHRVLRTVPTRSGAVGTCCCRARCSLSSAIVRARGPPARCARPSSVAAVVVTACGVGVARRCGRTRVADGIGTDPRPPRSGGRSSRMPHFLREGGAFYDPDGPLADGRPTTQIARVRCGSSATSGRPSRAHRRSRPRAPRDPRTLGPYRRGVPSPRRDGPDVAVERIELAESSLIAAAPRANFGLIPASADGR